MTTHETLSLDGFTFQVTETGHETLDTYSQTFGKREKNSENAPFKTMKDVFMTGLYLGVQSGQRRELTGKKEGPIRGHLFNHDEQLFMRAAAIGHTGETDVISDPKQVVQIAEEFANAGLNQLKQILETGAEGPLWDLAEHLVANLTSADEG